MHLFVFVESYVSGLDLMETRQAKPFLTKTEAEACLTDRKREIRKEVSDNLQEYSNADYCNMANSSFGLEICLSIHETDL